MTERKSTSMFLNGSKVRSLNLSRALSFSGNSSSKGERSLGRTVSISLLKPCTLRATRRKGITKKRSERENHVAHPKRYVHEGSYRIATHDGGFMNLQLVPIAKAQMLIRRPPSSGRPLSSHVRRATWSFGQDKEL